MIPQPQAFDDANEFVERELEGASIDAVSRAVGNRRSGQIAYALAIVTAAGNAVAALVSHERAEELHRQRAAWHRERARRSMAIARRA